MAVFEPSHLLNRLPEQFFASLTRKVQKLQKEGVTLINLGQGNPDRAAPAPIVEKMQEAAADPVNHKYSPFRGYASLKQAAAAFYKKEYDVDLDPETEIAVLFGSKAGLVELSQCLLNEGDTALLPDPGYPDYLSGIALAKAESAFMPLLEKNGFLPDYTAISEETWKKAKALFLNYPNNPTAAGADRTFFEDTVKYAEKHHVCVIHDFAYGALGFDGVKPPSFLQTPGAKETGVELYTLSKTYNMAGWRVAVAAGNASVIESLNLLQDHMYVSIFGAVQEAAAFALTSDQTEVYEQAVIYENRRNVFLEELEKGGIKALPSAGTFFVWLAVPKGWTSAAYAEVLLEKARIVTAPGSGFGSKGEGYIRISLLESEEQLQEAARRIAEQTKALHSL
ncbi:pyridoxal phosphate-dependent aminotransferase [Sinobaca sp. H24]|uniref:pyridoxal phosphate-dependent aminotransferase n=1 Tax=Sinobaca sp. H24 TaxID=2923376 RepID=UPI002079D656|nr:pyridoxal phosphate-dependent aminotransferase [Sinobaca sp. H24]